MSVITINEGMLREIVAECVRVLSEGIDDSFFDLEDEGKKDEIQRLVDEHNAQASTCGSEYIIGVTGRLGKYYTLYLFSKPIADFGKANPFLYKGNLSQKFSEAVKKVLERGTTLPIRVEREEEILSKIQRYRSQVFHNGKHQGESFEDVYTNDPKYILWMYEKLREESEIEKTNPYTHSSYTLTKAQWEMYKNLRPFVETYHQEQIQKRRETIDSVHIEGNKAENIEAVITRAPQVRDGMYGQYVEVRCKADNMYFLLYAKPQAFSDLSNPEVFKGGTVKIKSAQTEPIEIYGVKYNKLTRVKGLEILPAAGM